MVSLIGLTLCILVVGQLLVLFLSSLWRLAGEKKQHRLALALLQEQVEAARTRCMERDQIKLFWAGYRKFVIDRKVPEAENVCSFYLLPHDKKPLPLFKPGQYLTFQLKIPGQSKPTIRCYSLSDAPNADYYRVTIKKILPPRDRPELQPGLASSFFHEHLKEGDLVDVKAPLGQFVFDLMKPAPVVFIAGGVGITPLLSMLNSLTALGSRRETWFFYGVRNGCEHVMKAHMEKIARAHDNVRMRFCYSEPAKEEVKGRDYQFGQHVSVGLLKEQLPSNNYEFYICGPPPMMNDLVRDLKAWGVPEDGIFTEAFGPATVKKAFAPSPDHPAASTTGPALQISFHRSSKTCAWDPATGSLLDFALSQGVEIASGCRAGNCGTCETALISGKVHYLHDSGWKPQEGSCLTCITVPEGNIELDA